ncbi:STM3941 family protein [Rufibacter roseus]|uniref:STM3941 family protein n=1 Tax=Rufibacter roseus TaxID=1567108 RepID=A0ABW2DM89_9BACT|nr:STM3941 family protein [Rufibacter roseus]
MASLPPLDIPLSKKKSVKMLLLCIAFVLACWFIWDRAEDYAYTTLFRGVAMAGFAFFGLLCGGYGLFKLFDNRPGLVLDQHGIRDNSSAIAGKLIRWQQVTGLEERVIVNTPYLLVFVKNPEEVIRKENFFKQKIMRLNQKSYGTPLALSNQALQCDFEEMVKLVQQYYAAYGAVEAQ